MKPIINIDSAFEAIREGKTIYKTYKFSNGYGEHDMIDSIGIVKITKKDRYCYKTSNTWINGNDPSKTFIQEEKTTVKYDNFLKYCFDFLRNIDSPKHYTYFTK